MSLYAKLQVIQEVQISVCSSAGLESVCSSLSTVDEIESILNNNNNDGDDDEEVIIMYPQQHLACFPHPSQTHHQDPQQLLVQFPLIDPPDP